MASIFISYRREDSADVSGRINDRLTQHFGEEAIFTDVDSIPLGVNFRGYIDEQVGKCEIFLSVIGRDWLSLVGPDGRPRIEDPADFVRIEIESALQRNIPVIPLLVRDATIPAEYDLPASLKELAFRNGTPIRPNPDFHGDVDRLIKGIEKDLKYQSKTEPKHKPKDEKQDHGEPEAKRKADTEKQREAEAHVKSKAEEEKQHQAETEAKRWKHPLTFAMLILIAGLVFWWFKDIIFPPPFERDNLTLGIYIKEGQDTEHGQEVFGWLIKELNRGFAKEFAEEDAPAYRFREGKVTTYKKVNEMESALELGKVDIVGELSPYLVFKFSEKLNTTSLINPQYFGENYKSVFFAPDSASFIRRDDAGKIDKHESWREFRKLLRGSKDVRIAVAGQESTSGYWYPRRELLSEVDGAKSFDELTITVVGDSAKIRGAVCDGSQSVIAGAVAKFRFDDEDKFDKHCPDGSRLVVLREFGLIPHGAFVARKELFDDIEKPGRLRRLQERWVEAVERLFSTTKGSIKSSDGSRLELNDYFPETWKAQESSTYYAEAQKVFTYADKKADRKNQREKLLLLIATSILLLGALAYLKLQRAEPA